MDHGIPLPLDAAVQAAGIAMIYNDEDWKRTTRTPASNDPIGEPAANDPR